MPKIKQPSNLAARVARLERKLEELKGQWNEDKGKLIAGMQSLAMSFDALSEWVKREFGGWKKIA